MDELSHAARLAAGYLSAVPEQPVWRPVPADDRAWLTGQPLPDAGTALEDLLHAIRDHVLPYPTWAGMASRASSSAPATAPRSSPP